MSVTKLKIGLDYHGVIDSNPAYFTDFCTIARNRGHLIYVISGAPKATITSKLQSMQLPYDFIFSILDYCLAIGKIEQTSKGIMINNSVWDKAKAEFCKRCNVDLHIDDSTIYCRFFDNNYCLYNEQEKICQNQKGQIIDFNLIPSDTLDVLETIIEKSR